MAVISSNAKDDRAFLAHRRISAWKGARIDCVESARLCVAPLQRKPRLTIVLQPCRYEGTWPAAEIGYRIAASLVPVEDSVFQIGAHPGP